jgi:hypothetical protein
MIDVAMTDAGMTDVATTDAGVTDLGVTDLGVTDLAMMDGGDDRCAGMTNGGGFPGGTGAVHEFSGSRSDE